MGVCPIVTGAVRQAVGWVSDLVEVLLILDCSSRSLGLVQRLVQPYLVSHAKEWLG